MVSINQPPPPVKRTDPNVCQGFQRLKLKYDTTDFTFPRFAFTFNSRSYATAEKWQTVCGERECMTCARKVENSGLMMLKCGTLGSVIAQVNFAMWGVAADQGDWVLSDKAGMCGHYEFGLSNLTNATSVEEQNAVRPARYCSPSPRHRHAF